MSFVDSFELFISTLRNPLGYIGEEREREEVSNGKDKWDEGVREGGRKTKRSSLSQYVSVLSCTRRNEKRKGQVG